MLVKWSTRPTSSSFFLFLFLFQLSYVLPSSSLLALLQIKGGLARVRSGLVSTWGIASSDRRNWPELRQQPTSRERGEGNEMSTACSPSIPVQPEQTTISRGSGCSRSRRGRWRRSKAMGVTLGVTDVKSCIRGEGEREGGKYLKKENPRTRSLIFICSRAQGTTPTKSRQRWPEDGGCTMTWGGQPCRVFLFKLGGRKREILTPFFLLGRGSARRQRHRQRRRQIVGGGGLVVGCQVASWFKDKEEWVSGRVRSRLLKREDFLF